MNVDRFTFVLADFGDHRDYVIDQVDKIGRRSANFAQTAKVQQFFGDSLAPVRLVLDSLQVIDLRLW